MLARLVLAATSRETPLAVAVHRSSTTISAMAAEDYIWRFIGATRDYTLRVTDAIDDKADALAHQIRDYVSHTTWLPESARPSPPPPPPLPSRLDIGPASYDRLAAFTRSHRWTLALVAAGLTSAGGYAVYRRRHRQKKRRAKRAANNARKEVIVLVGSPHDAIAKSVALDLERRGFIVFIVVHSMDDEQVVLNEGRRDVRPLNIDLLDSDGATATVERFQSSLRHPVQAFAGAVPHHLFLAGMILVPSSDFPTGPIETLPAEAWSDTLNLRMLAPFLTAKLFVALLRDYHARLLVLTPAIIPALTPAFHAPEAAAVAAADAFAASLRRELKPLGVHVGLLKLGTFDLSSVSGVGRHSMHALNGARADIISWSSPARAAYARSYAAQAGAKGVRGTSLRELHHAVFDALVEKRPRRLVRVGSGSLMYDLVGRMAPEGFVGWMLEYSGTRTTAMFTKDESRVPSSEGSQESIEWEKVDK